MGCNCNNNNSNGGVIPWVRGNRLPLIICVYENVVTQEQVGDSTLTVNEMTRVPYTIQDNDTVTVIMKSGFRQVEMPFTTDGNKVMVTDNGELPTGAYTVEVTIERGDGARGRWQETRQVRIYENTSDAQLGEMYSIDADLFFYAKGDTGTGIADITNNPDGTLTITMTDGTSYTTEALKGDKGDKGDTGERGVSIVSFDVTGQTDVSVIYTVTFSDDTTQDISVPKGPQGDTGLTGNGISSTTLNSDYTLTIAYTDGTTYTTPSIRGAQGAQGVSVIGFTQTGETATNTMYNLVFSDGRTQSVAIPKGVKGDKGDTGNTGPQGAQGPKGDTVTATDYTLYNVQGSDSQGAMSQDATTKAISAQTGYYTCGTISGTAEKVVTVESGNVYKRTLGGHFKVQMTNANTASGVTLQIGSETAAALWYNGASASASNSWDAGEVISVYYDGSVYQASNAQGGGGKAEKIKYDNSQSGLAAENVQEALDATNAELAELSGEIHKLDGLTEPIPMSYTEGKYINSTGNLVSDASWMASDFLDISTVAAGDIFVWSGIKNKLQACLVFYAEDGTFMQAYSALDTSRTITIANNAAAIGTTKVRASFLINGTPGLSHNGTDVLKKNSHYAVSGMTELRNDVNALNVVVPMLSEFQQEAEPIVLNLQEYDYYDKSQTADLRIRFIYRNILGAVVQVSCQEGYSFGITYYQNTSPTGSSLYDSGWQTSEVSINIPSTGVGCLTINTRKSNNATITYEESVANVDKKVYIGSRKVSENVSEGSTDLITSGGVYAALNGGNDYAYSGDRIRLLLNKFDGHEYMALRHPSVSASGQGGGVYGDYFVQGGDGGHARVYNLSTKSIVVDSMDLAVVASTNHVNNIVFGKDFPSEGTFPYMYVSECKGQGRCFVENFNLEGSTLVQTINYNGNDVYQRNWVIDADNGFIYLVGNTQSAYNIQGNMVRVKKFTLPSPAAGDVVFTANDVLDTFDMDGSTGKAEVFQGNVIFNGKLYSCFGGAHTTHRIWINDLETHSLENVIELDQMYTGECESINIWNNSLLIGYPNQSKLYQLTF